MLREMATKQLLRTIVLSGISMFLGIVGHAQVLHIECRDLKSSYSQSKPIVFHLRSADSVNIRIDVECPLEDGGWYLRRLSSDDHKAMKVSIGPDYRKFIWDPGKGTFSYFGRGGMKLQLAEVKSCSRYIPGAYRFAYLSASDTSYSERFYLK